MHQSPRLRQVLPLLACALCLLVPPASFAADDDLYAFERVVADDSPKSRDAVLAGALQEVLIRITGDRQIAETPVGKDLIGRAGPLLQQYDYVQRAVVPRQPPLVLARRPEVAVPPPATSEDEAPPPPPAEELILHGKFDARVIARDLIRAGLPLWGRPRPSVVVALVLREGDVRLLTTLDPSLEWQTANELAQRRGLSLRLPPDISETGEPLWNLAPDRLADQLKVGATEILLRGRVTNVGDTWGAGWTLLHKGVVLGDWEHYAASLEEVLAVAVQRAADELAARFAVRAEPGQENYLGLRVLGVNSVQDYAEVQKYLQQMDTVASVELLRVNSVGVLYRVRTRGDLTAFEQALQMDRILAPEVAEGAGGAEGWAGEFRLTYRLVPKSETP